MNAPLVKSSGSGAQLVKSKGTGAQLVKSGTSK